MDLQGVILEAKIGRENQLDECRNQFFNLHCFNKLTHRHKAYRVDKLFHIVEFGNNQDLQYLNLSMGNKQLRERNEVQRETRTILRERSVNLR